MFEKPDATTRARDSTDHEITITDHEITADAMVNRSMTPVEDALSIALQEATRVFLQRCSTASTDTGAGANASFVPIESAVGRTLAEDVRALVPHPRFVASVMDGYALGTTDGAVKGSGSEHVDLRVVNAAVSRAGPTVEKATVGSMECAYVTTGAALPFGCDCVVPVEDCVVSSGGQVVTVKRKALSPGKWTRAIGSDVRGEGELLIAKGERISVFDVGVLKYASDSTVAVFDAPSIRILSTGDELVASSSATAKIGCVVDTNSPMLRALSVSEGGNVIDSRIVADEEASTLEAMREALIDDQCDVLITSGGASVGDRDYVYSAIVSLGGTIHFGRLAMKPGKPCMFATVPRGEKHNLLIFALPGNPVSAAVTFSLIVAPCLRALSGVNDPEPRRLHCTLAQSFSLDPSRPEYHRATLRWNQNAQMPVATSTGNQISSRLLSMRNANVLLELPKGQGVIEAGSIVSAIILSDMRHAHIHMSKISKPFKRARACATTTAPSEVSVSTKDGSTQRLKRVVGLEEEIRRVCRSSGVVHDSFTPLSMYSDGSTHVAITTARSSVLDASIASVARRLAASVNNRYNITSRAYARIGLIGNPSDAYGGKCIAVSISNFWAETTLRCTPQSPKVAFKAGRFDENEFDSFTDLASHANLYGVDGGIRLLKCLCQTVQRYCYNSAQEIDNSVGFELSYSSNIPTQAGLSGSSAIIISALDCLVKHFRIKITSDERAALALRVERDLGINAGPMDRVIQTYNGAVYMDFSEEKKKRNEPSGLNIDGEYTALDTSLLPPLFVVWCDEPSNSGKVHADVRRRWETGDSEVIQGMKDLASLTDAVMNAFTNLRDDSGLQMLKSSMDANFDIRRRLFGDAVLGSKNIEMIQMCRDVGCGAKFTGSGGACVVVCPDGQSQMDELMQTCVDRGFKIQQAEIHP